jgi:hypothetical protein
MSAAINASSAKCLRFLIDPPFGPHDRRCLIEPHAGAG